jgi:hypothetical protein
MIRLCEPMLAFYRVKARLIGLDIGDGYSDHVGTQTVGSVNRSSPFVYLPASFLYIPTFSIYSIVLAVSHKCLREIYQTFRLAMQEHEFVNQPKVSPHHALSSVPHPLDHLSSHEIDVAREAIFTARGKCLLLFRAIFTEEPAKAELVPFLEAEHSGTLASSTPRPARQARVQYDVVHDDKSHDYMESVVDILAGQEVLHRVIDKRHQSSLTL